MTAQSPGNRTGGWSGIFPTADVAPFAAQNEGIALSTRARKWSRRCPGLRPRLKGTGDLMHQDETEQDALDQFCHDHGRPQDRSPATAAGPAAKEPS